ncbi:hypothetical protein [Coralloluteibacterium stylophorae]|uniref:hypothetical protein n=1 Tax=Coralloluteibacterium stylophorae TaxID=1776034 RepID=UPI0036234262
MNASKHDPSRDSADTSTQGRDLNRDPITKAPGAHPVGVGVGTAVGGAAAGAAAGAFFGPIGSLIGVVAGGIAGAAAGKGVAERIDPTGEIDYWREAHAERPYVAENREAGYDYDRDYAAAYGFGLQAREANQDRHWDEGLEGDLGRDWDKHRGDSRLDWELARPAARDAWDRADRTHRTYQAVDRHHEPRHTEADYYDANAGYGYDDYRAAYRYGAQARSRNDDRLWDEDLERELARDWEQRRGTSRLGWAEARHAVRDAYDASSSYDSYDNPSYRDNAYDEHPAGNASRDALKVGGGPRV